MQLTNLQQLHELTGLEYIHLQFFFDIKDLTEYDNNDHPDIIWNKIKTKVDELENELKG